ncbi:carotenoid oxygenase family protein [Aspergillus lucknowensis]|uniref:Carotenoid oxygenase n=1 Tax=Aspergillus lucknowensis TaxID=176173 RepID=A0ABR4M2U8_9EURO
MPDIQETDTLTHFNNWPNEQGFEGNHEQKTPVELAVTGTIPSYAAGVLYRTGPGRYKVDTEHGNTFQVSHWFDGFSQTHRFQLVPADDTSSGMRVFYNSRFSTDNLVEGFRKTGSVQGVTFAAPRDPCKAMYQKVQSTFEQQEQGEEESESYKTEDANIGVTLSVNMPGLSPSSTTDEGESPTRYSGIRTLYAKTDNSNYKKIHPETLEPLGIANQTALHPDLNGPLSASHAKSDPKTGDMYNYNLSFAPAPTYRVFRVSAATGETTILATFPGTPSYLHSFFLSGDYVIVCAWNAHLSPQKFAKGTYMDAFQEFDPTLPAKWYVIDRKHDRGLVATYDSRAFFCFHTTNAWEEQNPNDPSKTDIVAECVFFENTDVMKKLYYELIVSSSTVPNAQPTLESKDNGGKLQSKIARFRLSAIPSASAEDSTEQPSLAATLESTSCDTLSPELPTLNPSFYTIPHRYTYAIIDRGHSTFFDGIMKFDSTTQETLIWSAHAQSPGEPIFVADPKGEREDDGLLLSVVLDGMSGNSYMLVLDAGSLREVGRASMQGVVAFGFHGQHVPEWKAGGGGVGVATGDF